LLLLLLLLLLFGVGGCFGKFDYREKCRGG